MIENLYSMRDQKLGSYDVVWQFKNDETLKRFFKQACNEVPVIRMSPADFSVYKIGTYDTDTALVTNIHPVEFVANGLDYNLDIQKEIEGIKNAKTKVSNDAPIQPSSKSGNPTVNV